MPGTVCNGQQDSFGPCFSDESLSKRLIPVPSLLSFHQIAGIRPALSVASDISITILVSAILSHKNGQILPGSTY